MRLVHVFKAAAEGYGPEKRVILRPAPARSRPARIPRPGGAGKSTIARLLKKGIEPCPSTADGALYTFDWINLDDVGMAGAEAARFKCPMNEEPLRLIPIAGRDRAIKELGLSSPQFEVKVDGELDPACRFIFNKLMDKYGG